MAGRKSKYYSDENIINKKIWSAALYIRLSQEDEDNGMSYRVDFYVGNTCCNFFSNSSHLDESIKEIFEKFGGKKN